MVCGEDIHLNHPSWANNYEQDLNPEDQNINLLADLINNSTHTVGTLTLSRAYTINLLVMKSYVFPFLKLEGGKRNYCGNTQV